MNKTHRSKMNSADAQASVLRGQVQGAFVLIGAGLGWIMFALSTQGPVPLAALLMVLAVPAVLVLKGVLLRRKTKDIPDQEWSPEMSRVFRLACLFEVVAGLLIVIIAGVTHHTEWILPLLAVAVGLHFFPLARVFVRPIYYAAGALLCLDGVATLLFVPKYAGVSHVSEWPLIAGVGAGITLWSTAWGLLMQSSLGLEEHLRR